MIYLLSTNRPDWAEYAHRQYKRFVNAKLIVLDNTKDGIEYWVKHADLHCYLPNCKNVGQMFNWYLDNYEIDDYLFYADDDIEYHPKIQDVMINYLKSGYDLVINSSMFASNSTRSCLFIRKPWCVGAAWMITKEVIKLDRFGDTKIAGSCEYLKKLINPLMHGVNFKNIFTPFVNLIVHKNNVAQKKDHFIFNLPRVDWDNK